MPMLEFKGKPFVYSHHLSVPFRELVLDSKRSVPGGKKTSPEENLVIHGDIYSGQGQTRVEAHERGADHGGGGEHGSKALAHCVHAADRGERGLGGAGAPSVSAALSDAVTSS